MSKRPARSRISYYEALHLLNTILPYSKNRHVQSFYDYLLKKVMKKANCTEFEACGLAHSVDRFMARWELWQNRSIFEPLCDLFPDSQEFTWTMGHFLWCLSPCYFRFHAKKEEEDWVAYHVDAYVIGCDTILPLPPTVEDAFLTVFNTYLSKMAGLTHVT